MKELKERLKDISWDRLAVEMNEKGYALVTNILTKKECLSLTDLYSEEEFYRKTIAMERYRFGVGEYKYFRYPLPPLLQEMRQTVYPYLAPVANGWMEALKIPNRYPSGFEDWQKTCQAHHQDKPTVLILKYGAGGHNTLHQDLYGEIYFPIQMVLSLNEPEEDYMGGEFVLTEQRPRAQSKAIVLRPKRGDLLFFTTQFRPVKGSKGYYRANMKHGISPLHSGQRHSVGIIFHDAAT